MVASKLLTVAVLMAALLAGGWVLNDWDRRGSWPRLLRKRRSRVCAASRRYRIGWRRHPLSIRPLPPQVRSYYADARRNAEVAFSTAPGDAVQRLDLLAAEALGQCGYPVDTFEHEVVRILPAAPQVVEDYRTAHLIALANESGIASESELRLATFHYHALLRTLLEADDPGRLARSRR